MTQRSKFPPTTREVLSLTVDGLNQKFLNLATFTLEETVFDGEPSFVVAAVLPSDGDIGEVWLSLAHLKSVYRNVGYSVCCSALPVVV